jgi:hypothetical protein
MNAGLASGFGYEGGDAVAGLISYDAVAIKSLIVGGERLKTWSSYLIDLIVFCSACSKTQTNGSDGF